MQTVRQLLEQKSGRVLVTVTPESTVFQALQVMAEHDIGAVLVMDGGEVVGIFPNGIMPAASCCRAALRPAPAFATS
jgi:CBS domain-containing protein